VKKWRLLDNILGPSPVDTTDETQFNIYFSPTAPLRPTSEFILGTSGISPVTPPLIIPPNEVKTFTTQFKVESDISPAYHKSNMHLLGKSFIAYAINPQGDTIPLIRIKTGISDGSTFTLLKEC
jgi:hypothetical protein